MTTTSKMEVPTKVWEALEQLKTKTPNKSNGICLNVQVLSCDLDIFSIRRDYFYYCVSAYRDWPKYTGDGDYPVPHHEEDPDVAFDFKPLWDRRTQYGRDRWELLDHLIVWYKEKDI